MLHTHRSFLSCKTLAHLWMKPDFQLHTQRPAEQPLRLFPWKIPTGQKVLLLLPVPSSQWDLCPSLGAEWILTSEKSTVNATTYIGFTKSVFTGRKTGGAAFVQKAVANTACKRRPYPFICCLMSQSEIMSCYLSSMFKNSSLWNGSYLRVTALESYLIQWNRTEPHSRHFLQISVSWNLVDYGVFFKVPYQFTGL